VPQNINFRISPRVGDLLHPNLRLKLSTGF